MQQDIQMQPKIKIEEIKEKYFNNKTAKKKGFQCMINFENFLWIHLTGVDPALQTEFVEFLV